MDTTANTDAVEVTGDPKTDAIKNDGDASVASLGDVKSNHNTSHAVDPVNVMFLQGRPDYNPMREGDTPNRANDKSDTTLVPETAKALIEDKGDRMTQAEAVMRGNDVAGNTGKPVEPDTFVRDPRSGVAIRGKRHLADEIAESDRSADRAPAGEAKPAETDALSAGEVRQ